MKSFQTFRDAVNYEVGKISVDRELLFTVAEQIKDAVGRGDTPLASYLAPKLEILLDIALSIGETEDALRGAARRSIREEMREMYPAHYEGRNERGE